MIQASVVRLRGASKQIRSDKGPESIAKAIWAWMAEASPEELYIDPKALWENEYAEEFTSLLQAQVLVKDCKRDQNLVLPSSSRTYRILAE